MTEYREKGVGAVRPREASTLIIVRKTKDAPHILMGKRSAKHKFMPNKFVFPGGRLDLIDSRLKVPHDLPDPVMRRLRQDTRKDVSDAKLRGLALAAIRETYEETGLIIGHKAKAPPRTRHHGWRDYFASGATPPLDKIDFIGRAITPTYRTRRYDTRFFMLHDDTIFTDPEDTQNASGELLHLHWLTLQQARDLDIPAITRQMLDIVEKRLRLSRP
ncbi:MAG: NUDIX hydrolase, partial [Alphaproteobacteria bacterium]|nr:NUDIX hydrolase [Alphaproteobacteria bacterium]